MEQEPAVLCSCSHTFGGCGNGDAGGVVLKRLKDMCECYDVG